MNLIASAVIRSLPLWLLLTVAAPDYTGLATHFIDTLSQRHFEEASKQFDEKMTQALPAKKLQETWEGLTAQVGDFQKIVETHTEEKQGFQLVIVTCAFVKAKLDARIAIDSKGLIAGLHFVPAHASPSSWSPPSYTHPNHFQERSVTVGAAPWLLPGMLTVPIGQGPFPGVLLVQGSGPQDMDESIGDIKPLKDLAWGLASQGIAVLRYDKRTQVHGTEMLKLTPQFTVKDETLDDAEAAADLLRQCSEVDPHQVFILGHSLGGMLAPRIAAADSKIAGIIILAGPARPLQSYLVEQAKHLAAPAPENKQAQSRLLKAQETTRLIDSPSLRPDSVTEVFGALIPGSYWIDLRKYNAVECARGLSMPILVLQGGDDSEVDATDLDLWKTALAGHSNASFHLYPGLSHFLMVKASISTSSKPFAAEHVAPEVVDDIAAWLRKRQPASSNSPPAPRECAA